MDYEKLKKASELFETKWSPSKSDVECLLEDSSEEGLFNSLVPLGKREICSKILNSGYFPHIINSEFKISNTFIKKELKRYLATEEILLVDFKASVKDFVVTLASNKWFKEFVQPDIWITLDRITLNSKEQSLFLQYGFYGSLFDFAINSISSYKAPKGITFVDSDEFGGTIKIDLSGFLKDFEKKYRIKDLDCSIFHILSFNMINHKSNSVVITCDCTWKEIIKRILMRLEILEAQRGHGSTTPNIWMIHRPR